MHIVHASSIRILELNVPRLLPLTAALVFSLGFITSSQAQNSSLPDMGSSAAELLNPEQEAEYGAYTLYQLRNYGYVLDDPLLDAWLQGMGHRLGASSDRPEQPFTFFLLKERQINAFATFGGYIGVNAGLILTAQAEDEVAGVLAHEISHVTQRHILRSAERSQKDQLPILLGMLAVVVAAQQSSSNSADDATQAAIIGSQALIAQRQINFTRSNEAEADRIGIQTLYRSQYRAGAMADFFERMAAASRGNSGGYQAPDYLRSHPVTTTRISEARDRAARIDKEAKPVATSSNSQINPLIPSQFNLQAENGVSPPLRQFEWARERLRTLTAASPQIGVNEFKGMTTGISAQKLTDPQNYGYALALMQSGSPGVAEGILEQLKDKYPDNLWVELAYAENAHYAKNPVQSRQRFEALLKKYPQHVAISLTYARTLGEIGNADAGRRAQTVLRPLLAESAEDPVFQKSFGRASELAGDINRAIEAYAEVAYLNGRPEDALKQLDGLLKKENLDYVQRARVEARMAAMTPEVLEMRRQGVKPSQQPPDRS
ncbi:MAG TPA: M48 family metalloprotease [Arenimonas sp.]|nr:M48 family metalloprotease [Arenimonas sp.]HOZ04427.1 M48 family metalloprotease [Arenimonas sp.]HPW32972.1 M48 family metalloprotease [Arenimonas sp.]